MEAHYHPQLARELFQAVEHATGKALDSATASKFRCELNAEQLKTLAASYLQDSHTSANTRVKFEEILNLYHTHSAQILSPNYMGHQVPPAHPLAAAMDGFVSVLNQGLAVEEMSPLATAIEHAVVAKLCEVIGWDKRASGIATSGGTLANMTAILAARNKAFPNYWKEGPPKDQRPALIASKEAHYSIARAAGVLGLGMNSIVTANIDARRRMTGRAVEESLAQAKDQGLKVFCVVASAPSTPIGAIDHLEDIAEVCQKAGVWLHVDAVHGAPFLFSKTLRDRLSGINEADSVTWDAHKMMHVASLCTFVLYRSRSDSFLAFENKASYLFQEGSEEEALRDLGKRTFECTKRAMSTPLWALWSVYGSRFFTELSESLMKLSDDCHALLQKDPEFDAPYVPDSNILVFRHIPKAGKESSTEELNLLQRTIRSRILAAREFYITQTTLDGRDYLRVTLINPMTKPQHFEALLKHIKQLAL